MPAVAAAQTAVVAAQTANAVAWWVLPVPESPMKIIDLAPDTRG